ncbi:universal stress protein [Fructilactobacillus fructivorans]|uniref:Universal stress protein n=1 Tax=Fructilactobacillus fructivorans TaxID=1614 RepID=A0A0C1PK93_9LACO|nr:universal stress protein [Fructilactobacillus fructivorans]KID41142.1 Universal stress protein family [Fructilactobacillus fructivorans]KRK57477.1 UspA family nucleotide-binding protein [Fructilactobacillus fructivorans]KRN12373.1 UspA family nucleotide-binding protein [Fructilactobacillus fructivorans]KRN41133.1 UspA family nucleotide-binding protein [Fructilactobacillus fructivorans]KRN42003.1 UspA family nucleotide-binding protein [Fructilactobacillus fructivorans]
MAKNYKRILAPVDGAEDTMPVMSRAITMAKQNDSHLDILNVIEVNQFNRSYGDAITADAVYQLTDKTKKILETLKQQATDAGVSDVSIHMRFGNPKKVIAKEFPSDHHDDLIIIGATGLSAVERLMVGSVTSYVTRAAKQDVLVVK